MMKIKLVLSVFALLITASAWAAFSPETIITDPAGTNQAAVKAASTAPQTTDTALVVTISPNTPTLGVSTDITKFGGSNVVTGIGASGSGIPRVSLSNDSLVGLNAGANLVGKVGIDQTTPGTTNGVQINAAIPAGSNVIGAVTQSGSPWGFNLSQVAGSSTATGHGTASGSIRVELPTDGTGVVGLNAGTNLVGKVGIDQTTPGTTNGVQVNAALPAGSNTIGAVTQASGPWTVNQTQVGGSSVTLGSKTSANSFPVVIASDQGNVPVAQAGKTKANAPVYNDYSSTNVTTSAYVQVIASTSSDANVVEIFDSSGQAMILAVGGSGSEVDQLYIVPGGNGRVPLKIASGSRVSIKAKTATASVGYLLINLYN